MASRSPGGSVAAPERTRTSVADEAMQHTPVAEEGEVCICLAATDAPLKFNAIIPRLAQPFLRI